MRRYAIPAIALLFLLFATLMAQPYPQPTPQPIARGIGQPPRVQSQQYVLTVTIIGTGTVAKSPDKAKYTSNIDVTLTATAGAGWVFSGWSGDASGSTNPLTVTMTAAKSITATFAFEGVLFAGAQTITLGDADALDGTGTRTYDAWLRVPATTGVSTIKVFWSKLTAANPFANILLEQQYDSLRVLVSGAGVPQIIQDGFFVANTWVHFRLVMDGTKLWLYKDVALQNGGGTNYTVGAANNIAMWFGYWDFTTDRYWVGDIACPRVWSTVHTTDDRATLYAAGTTGLLAQWSQVTGSTYTDITGSFNGTLGSAAAAPTVTTWTGLTTSGPTP